MCTFRQDIANIVRSVNQAGGGTAAIVHQEIEKAMRQGAAIDPGDLAEHMDLYQQGYRDALGAIAAAFGILPTRQQIEAPAVLAVAVQAEAWRIE